MDLMSGRGSKKSNLKSPAADTLKPGVKGGKGLKMIGKRKMKSKR